MWLMVYAGWSDGGADSGQSRTAGGMWAEVPRATTREGGAEGTEGRSFPTQRSRATPQIQAAAG